MTSAQLPPLNFDNRGLRVSLLPELKNRISTFSSFAHDPEPESYDTLDSARYSELYAAAEGAFDDDHEDDMHETEPPADSPPQQTIPIHPIPALQEAFAESLHEVTSGTAADKPKLRELDAAARREVLLKQDQDDLTFDAAWRFRPGQTQHEIAKLISQISFGVYLLLNGMANSNTQVVNILQGHIDEVDEFLEVTIEDLAEADKDLQRRIDHLMIPMANMKVFEQLLEDRKYRTEILEGNEKIEHTLARTNVAMKQWDEDIDVGLNSSNLFINWLNENGSGEWRAEHSDVVDIFDAMRGNAEGWLLAFEKISDSAQDINAHIIRLMNIISEMEKKAGEVSRRTWANIAPFSSPPRTSTDVNVSSPTTPASSYRSPPRTNGQVQIRNSIVPGFRPGSSTDDGSETVTIEFPMPAGAPLIPPLRASLGRPFSHFGINPEPSNAPPTREPEAEAQEPEFEGETTRESQVVEPLFILQPRTYTPQPPAPLPSPLLKDSSQQAGLLESRSNSHPTPRPEHQSTYSTRVQSQFLEENEDAQGSSLRERVSLKTSPPDDIQIPSRMLKGMEMYAHSPSNNTPRTTTSRHLESAYGSDAEYHNRHQAPSASSQRDLSPPVYPNVMPSPRSDQQRYYHPVIASPHSPLQQRPHTAVGHAQPAYYQSESLMPPHQLRNKPSKLGGMSTLSSVTAGSHDESRSIAPMMRGSKAGDKQLKKKKSAFGWFKKAFSMDEEERAAYEARKAMQYQDTYYNANAPKFLDGKRLR